MEVVDSICHFSVDKFVKNHLKSGQTVRSDALPALNIIDQTQHYEARVTPSYLVDEDCRGYISPSAIKKHFCWAISWSIGKIPARIL